MGQPNASLEGIDLAGGLQRVGGREALYRSLLRLYVTHCADTCAKVREALAAGDLATAERLVHSLKGSSGQIAAGGIEAAASGIEMQLREGAHAAQVGPQLAELEEDLSALLAGLGELLRDPVGIAGSLQPGASLQH